MTLTDIDECIEYSQDCGPEKMCFNTRGEFTCIDIPCPEKYQRDPLTRLVQFMVFFRLIVYNRSIV